MGRQPSCARTLPPTFKRGATHARDETGHENSRGDAVDKQEEEVDTPSACTPAVTVYNMYPLV
ncbi:hypothetical protein EON66_04160 [archaeon]|nr:MAG: hypothetical protein EON66_04160 [archaeon]